MPKQPIVCPDGKENTGNQTDPGHPCVTNVPKLARCLGTLTDRWQGQSQVVYSHPAHPAYG